MLGAMSLRARRALFAAAVACITRSARALQTFENTLPNFSRCTRLAGMDVAMPAEKDYPHVTPKGFPTVHEPSQVSIAGNHPTMDLIKLAEHESDLRKGQG